MESDPLRKSIHKLAMAGEQAGLSVEDMIVLLNAGVTVETLLCLIERRLALAEPLLERASCWIM